MVVLVCFLQDGERRIPVQYSQKVSGRKTFGGQDVYKRQVKDTRPSAKLSYARVSVQKACFLLDAIRGKSLEEALGIVMYNPRYASSLIETVSYTHLDVYKRQD